MTWVRARLKDLCVDAGQYGLNISADSYAESGTRLIRTSDIAPDGSLGAEGVYVDALLDPRHTLQRGDLLLSRSGTLGRSFLTPKAAEGATFAGYLVRFRPRNDVDPRFLAYVAQSLPFQDAVRADAVSSTIQNFNAERYGNVPLHVPPLEEQWRIADFLDAEISALAAIDAARQRIAGLLSLREEAIIDGALAGDEAVLHDLRVATSKVDVPAVKLSRICRIVPGYAFASERFSRDSDDVRLLRGINVGSGRVDWRDAVYWPRDECRLLDRFFLRAGDLVMAMDRPWISTGMRAAVLTEGDVPSLLLQRVACLRPALVLDREYLFWAVMSSHFRAALEGDVTGVSVPHISADQIGSHILRLPGIENQRAIAEAVSLQVSAIKAIQDCARRQSGLLAERRIALITAAVTGQIDVSAARGGGI